jgi:anti-sigma regulatory factor (Ser/Thr protein kinase)
MAGAPVSKISSLPLKLGVVPQVAVELLSKLFAFPVSPALHEDEVWQGYLAPELSDLPDNVKRICQHGLTEMINNVIDHSGASQVVIHLRRSKGKIQLNVLDNGIGVFEKIRTAMGLADFKDASLELYKGKFTTDPTRHSGEGIFFTSRAFDLFALSANGCAWTRIGAEIAKPGAPEFENFRHDGEGVASVVGLGGTMVRLEIDEKSSRQLKDVFDSASVNPGHDFAFDKTSFPLAAAQTATGALVSRSQAKRVLARLENFKAVELDFAGVAEIGQAFADEIFRVFRAAHPGVALSWINAAPDVERMIRRASV